jgi:hypothetical protein
MKATSAILKSPRFPVVWTDDRDPPPGKEAAQALFGDLLVDSRVRANYRTIDDNDYEHSSWFFILTFNNSRFTCFLEGHPDPEHRPGTWRVSITKDLGVFQALFGRRDTSFEVPDDCLKLLEDSICRVFEVEGLHWLTEDEALGKFLSEFGV